MTDRFVVIESPYGTNPDGSRADPETMAENVRYLHACILDCLRNGEIPYASHGFFPGPLRDVIPEERDLGIKAGFAVARVLASVGAVRAFYMDRGWTGGMQLGRVNARGLGQEIEYRRIPGWSGSGG